MNDGNVILFGDQVCNGVDIIDKGTDNTDAGHIIQLILNILRSKLIAEFFELFVNTFRFFDPCLDEGDRVTFIFQ